MVRFTIIHGKIFYFLLKLFPQKLYGAIFKGRISVGSDNSEAAEGIVAEVVVVVLRKRCDGHNGEHVVAVVVVVWQKHRGGGSWIRDSGGRMVDASRQWQ